jgi:hypothetical protein
MINQLVDDKTAFIENFKQNITTSHIIVHIINKHKKQPHEKLMHNNTFSSFCELLQE